MDKVFDWIFRNFGKLWLTSFVVGILLLGVAVWAVIRLVLHFTS